MAAFLAGLHFAHFVLERFKVESSPSWITT